jgi:hypothetical protein
MTLSRIITWVILFIILIITFKLIMAIPTVFLIALIIIFNYSKIKEFVNR